MDKTLETMRLFRGYGRREKTEMKQRLKKMLIDHNTWQNMMEIINSAHRYSEHC